MAIKEPETQESTWKLRVLQMENTLKWIRYQATLHYMGEAFMPEHMRHIANMAADALEWQPWDNEGKYLLPEFDETWKEAKEKAAGEADELWKWIEESEPTDGDDNNPE